MIPPHNVSISYPPPPIPEYHILSTDLQHVANEFNRTTPPSNEAYGPLSLEEIKDKAQRAKRRLCKSSHHRNYIEQNTKDQHQSPLWYAVRQPRITASKAKRCLLKDTTSPTKAVAAVLQYTANIQTKAIREGIEWEGKIIERYEYISGNKVAKSGFVVSAEEPFLGASSDGVIHNGAGVIEVKKVTSKEGESYEDTLCRLNIYKRKEGQITMNPKHAYYTQVQQQMYCTGCLYCHFIVSNGTWVHVDVLSFNKPFWNDVLLNLKQFYFRHIFPEIIYPRIKYGSERWGKDVSFPLE